MVHETETEFTDNDRNVMELRVENLADHFSNIIGNDSGGLSDKPLSSTITNNIENDARNANMTNNPGDVDRNVHENNNGVNKSALSVPNMNNIGELSNAPSNIDNATIAIMNGADLNTGNHKHVPGQTKPAPRGGVSSFFDRFRRQCKAANVNLKDEKSDDRNGRPGCGVQFVRCEKIDPSLDANNNISEGIDGVTCGGLQKNGGPDVLKRKKMSDSEDDTRPIIRPSGDPEIPDVQSRTPDVISWWTWIAYSQGHVYNDLCASMWFTYLMPYLQKCVRLSPGNAGLLMLIGQVADALATPVVGLLSDRGSAAWYCSLGRRKTWHILGTMLITITFPFIFSPILSFLHLITEKSRVIYYIPFICFFQFGWASAQIAHLSLVPDLTPNENERTSLLSVRYAFTVISNLLVYVIMYIAVHTSNTPGPDHLGPQDSTKFQYISYIVVILGFLATLIFYAGVSEIRNRRLQLDLRQTTSSQMYEARKRTPRQLLGTTALYTVGVLYMTARMFFNILQMFIVFYVQDTLHLSKANIAVVPLVILISGFVTSLRVKQVNERLGRKMSHLIGLVLGVLVSVIVFVGTHQASVFKIYQVYAIAILYGMSSTVIQVTSFGMAADFVGDDVSNGAFIYGVLSFADKTSNGVVGFLIQKFNPEEGYYYRLALSYGCGIPCLIGILALLFLPPVPQVTLKPRETDRQPVVTSASSEDELDSTSPR